MHNQAATADCRSAQGGSLLSGDWASMQAAGSHRLHFAMTVEAAQLARPCRSTTRFSSGT